MKNNKTMWNGFELILIRTYHKNAIKEYKTSNKELLKYGSIGRILMKRTNGKKAPENILVMELDMRNNEGSHPFSICLNPNDSCIAILNENYIRNRKFDADGNPIDDTDELYIEKPFGDFGDTEHVVQWGWDATIDDLSALLEKNREFFLDNYLGAVEGRETNQKAVATH